LQIKRPQESAHGGNSGNASLMRTFEHPSVKSGAPGDSMSKLQEEKVDDDDGYEYYAEDEDGEEESVPKGKIEEMLARRSKPKDLPKAPKLAAQVPQERTEIEKFGF
jgi:outer membrane biosynthesis protein TonB